LNSYGNAIQNGISRHTICRNLTKNNKNGGNLNDRDETGCRFNHRRSNQILEDLKTDIIKTRSPRKDKGHQSRKKLEISPIRIISILKGRVRKVNAVQAVEKEEGTYFDNLLGMQKGEEKQFDPQILEIFLDEEFYQ
jgi:hypothetical protein